MKIIVSCHCDTVFRDPYCSFKQGILRGACDNFASILAVATILDDPMWLEPNIELQLTEDEEMYMDGAKSIVKKNNPKDTLIIVMDVTNAKIKGSMHFTIENFHEVRESEIRKSLKDFKGQYRLVPNGTESEAWIYAEHGFSVIELDIPVAGGLHSLDSTSKRIDQSVASKALLAMIYYFKDKEISAIRSEDN